MAIKKEHYERTLLDRLQDFSRDIFTNPSALIGTIIVTTMISVSLVGPSIAPFDPTAIHGADRLQGPIFLDAENSKYILGTDNLGRDLLSRTLLGGRGTLLLGMLASGLALAVGVPIGMFSGYVGGKVDEVIMRFMDALLSLPGLLLALLILTTLSSNIWNAIIAVGIGNIPPLSRIIRSATISEKQEEYVLAAEARGESTLSVLFGEIFPNIISVIVVEGTIRVGFAILAGSSLSFLGLGAQPPTPDWGYMVAQARVHTYSSIWFLLWPALALATTILGFNILGDGLRDVLDPQVTSRD